MNDIYNIFKRKKENEKSLNIKNNNLKSNQNQLRISSNYRKNKRNRR